MFSRYISTIRNGFYALSPSSPSMLVRSADKIVCINNRTLVTSRKFIFLIIGIMEYNFRI